MIISASRRTDIPSYFSEWFFNRINEGFVYVRNPMNIHQISNISLAPEVVDGIVFWTKNPTPFIPKIHMLDNYTYYFQFTLNSYGRDIETNIPSKKECIIPTFQQLSRLIGKERIVWRYDPIFLNDKYTLDYHIKYFELLANKLSGYTDKCTISFLDIYRNTQRNIAPFGIICPSKDQIEEIVGKFSDISQKYGFNIDTCAEKINLENFGIQHAKCIDKKRFERIGDFKLDIEKDKSQRPECGCFSSIDIGAYNTCKNGCVYCYANFNKYIVSKNFALHNPQSPLLFGNVSDDDKIYVRDVRSCKNCQIKFKCL